MIFYSMNKMLGLVKYPHPVQTPGSEDPAGRFLLKRTCHVLKISRSLHICNIIVLSLILNILYLSNSYPDQLKVDPYLYWLEKQAEKFHSIQSPAFLAPFFPKVIREEGRGPKYLVFIVPSDMAEAIYDLRASGGTARRAFRNLIAAVIDSASLSRLRGSDSIALITPVRTVRPCMDVALPLIGADRVHQGADGAFSPYSGKNVVMGTVDTGIDLTHPDFQHPDGSTRVLFLWDHTQEGNHPDGFDHGKECDANSINSGGCGEEDGFSIDDVLTLGHGTHVAGIAAGNDPAYMGVAPESHLIVAKVKMDELSLLEGAYYIVSKVDELNLPAVINISLGTNEGAHDGTSALELGIAELAGPGLVLTVSGGNEGAGKTGDNLIHLSYDADEDPTYTRFSPASDNLGLNAIIIEAWYDPPDTGNGLEFAVGVEDENGENILDITGFAGDDRPNIEETLFDGTGNALAEVYIDAPAGANPLNNARQALITVSPPDDGLLASLHSRNWVLAVMASRPGGAVYFDAWISSDNAVFHEFGGLGPENATAPALTYAAGDDQKSLVIPATARNVFSVGSYVSRTEWTDDSGSPHYDYGVENGQVSFFSSPGPTRDERQKPELVAPGEMIASAFSSSVGSATSYRVDADHSVLSGSSMATPVVSGAIALMLERNPGLGYAEILDLLSEYALSDEFTGATPNHTVGYGKLDLNGLFEDPDFPETAVPDTYPPTITGISFETGETFLEVTWTTDEIAGSRTTVRRGSGPGRDFGTDSYTYTHNVLVNGLESATEYTLVISSTDPSGNLAESAELEIRTAGEPSGCGCSHTAGNVSGRREYVEFLVLLGLLVSGMNVFRKKPETLP